MSTFINVQTPRLMFFTVHSAWILQPLKKEYFLVLIKMALEMETVTSPFTHHPQT